MGTATACLPWFVGEVSLRARLAVVEAAVARRPRKGLARGIYAALVAAGRIRFLEARWLVGHTECGEFTDGAQGTLAAADFGVGALLYAGLAISLCP
jgi:hypothetical protein